MKKTMGQEIENLQGFNAQNKGEGFGHQRMKRNICHKLASCMLALTLATSSFIFTMVQSASAEIPSNIKVPSFSSLQSNAKLPDPFKFLDGTRMTTKEQWTARRQEISALAQTFEYGIKPPKPQTVTGSFSSNALTVTCSQNGKTTSFKCPITYPTTGKAPYPAMIGVGMDTLNTSEILKLGVALITLPSDEIAVHNDGTSRGKGKFFDIYGSSYDAGAMIAWAWGASCMIDALEATPAAKIDTKHLGVTGGSRWGKGALCVGAFDERIALIVPQESGNGGASGWRTADAMKAAGTNVQTLSEIIGENCWFSKALNQFSNNTNKLPFDHHEILALCAPRGLLVIENTSMEWLGNQSCFDTCTAAHMIYEGLGIPDRMGYSTVGGHDHCVFPASQQPELTAYIQKFLLGNSAANTTIFKTDKAFTFNKTKWVDWTIPALTGTLPSVGDPTPTPTPNDPKIVYGDVNEDGKVNSSDCSIMKRYLLEMITTFQSDNAKKAADVNKDGRINSTDYSAMKRIVLENMTGA